MAFGWFRTGFKSLLNLFLGRTINDGAKGNALGRLELSSHDEEQKPIFTGRVLAGMTGDGVYVHNNLIRNAPLRAVHHPIMTLGSREVHRDELLDHLRNGFPPGFCRSKRPKAFPFLIVT